MTWFKNLKIASKLGIGFGVCLILALIVGVTAIMRMSQMNEGTKSIVGDALAGTSAMVNIMGDMKQFRTYEYRHILNASDREKQQTEETMRTMLARIDRGMDKYAKTLKSAEDRANFEELQADWKTYLSTHDQLLAVSRRDDQKGAMALMVARRTASNALEDQLDKISEWNTKHGDELAREAASTYASARTIMIALLSLAVLVGAFCGWFISRMITGTLSLVSDRLLSLRSVCLTNLGQAMQALAQGDLTATVESNTQLINVQSKDELGKMAEDVNGIIQQTQTTIDYYSEAQQALNRLVGKTRSSADSIAEASTQLATGSEDLSQRTTEQASSLEETASSMEEMTATIKQNADNARQANQLASQAREVAEKGGDVVTQAVSSMEEINASSKRIADIISVIDEIAFQTNLLALNASVEAARVGEQGRGFAVVAAEVRNLAGRSAAAAKEIKALVADSVGKVQEGSALVDRSGQTLIEIVSAVKKVADIIAEISAASQEQSVGIEQVNKAILQMDQITQQNAALVEEASVATQSMNLQARELQSVAGSFKLDTRFLSSVFQESQPSRKEKKEAVEVLQATGTDGSLRNRKARSRPKLALSIENDKGEFEEF